MPRNTTIDIDLKKNSKIRTVFLFLSDADDPDAKLRSLRTGKNGKGHFQVDAPGRYKILWHIRGETGGAIRLEVTEGGRTLGVLDKEISVITGVGEHENSGRLRFNLEA